MQISDKDLKALSTINVEELTLTTNQKNALGRVVQSIRSFLAKIEELNCKPAEKNHH